jgi:hypothetical protein
LNVSGIDDLNTATSGFARSRESDGFYLYEIAVGKPRDSDHGSRRMIGAKGLRVNRVELREMLQADKVTLTMRPAPAGTRRGGSDALN